MLAGCIFGTDCFGNPQNLLTFLFQNVEQNLPDYIVSCNIDICGTVGMQVGMRMHADSFCTAVIHTFNPCSNSFWECNHTTIKSFTTFYLTKKSVLVINCQPTEKQWVR